MIMNCHLHYVIKEAKKEIGSLFGEYRLDIMHLKGLGVSQDRDEALYWLKRAAEKGHPKAKEVYERISSRFL